MVKNRMIMLLIIGTALVFGPTSLLAMEKEANTIDDLVAMFDESSCMDCHEEIHEQWSKSWHARAVVSSLGSIHNFIEIGIKKEWETEVTRAQLLKCLDCHAPIVNYASDKLAAEIADMIVTATKEKGKAAGDAAKMELSKLKVGCLSCHSMKALTVAPGFNGPSEEGVIYGPHGEDAGDAHETEESPDIDKAAFCMQCHGIYTAADGETIQCNTISGSYLNAYIAGGGAKTCQDCHMDKGHHFGGGRDPDMVMKGLGFDVQINPYRHLPGQIKDVKDPKKWVPSAVVTILIENKAGHRIPDG